MSFIGHDMKPALKLKEVERTPSLINTAYQQCIQVSYSVVFLEGEPWYIFPQCSSHSTAPPPPSFANVAMYQRVSIIFVMLGKTGV
jgi:hypothetical protein